MHFSSSNSMITNEFFKNPSVGNAPYFMVESIDLTMKKDSHFINLGNRELKGSVEVILARVEEAWSMIIGLC